MLNQVLWGRVRLIAFFPIRDADVPAHREEHRGGPIQKRSLRGVVDPGKQQCRSAPRCLIRAQRCDPNHETRLARDGIDARGRQHPRTETTRARDHLSRLCPVPLSVIFDLDGTLVDQAARRKHGRKNLQPPGH